MAFREALFSKCSLVLAPGLVGKGSTSKQPLCLSYNVALSGQRAETQHQRESLAAVQTPPEATVGSARTSCYDHMLG